MKKTSVFNAAVIVAALGYFVDIYDLLLFSIVRKDSLSSLGLSGEKLTDNGILLINVQMAGLLIGGILWGMLGDKRGRLSVLFGSIFTYSLANIANGFVQSVEAYAIWRFIAGIGLAGELGVGITLVTEIMPKETRGYATTVVASVGIAGAVFAAKLAESFEWRTCYFIGGGMGLLLLALRMGVTESGMFKAVKQDAGVKRGNFLLLFKRKDLFMRYLRLILIGVPIWYVVGILMTLAPELAPYLGITEKITGGRAVMYCYGGMVIGDLISGSLSQLMKSRKKVLLLFHGLQALTITCYFVLRGLSPDSFYVLCAMMGVSVGSWVVFMTSSAEQFGTNIRATVTTTVPNFVRFSLVPLNFFFVALRDVNLSSGHVGPLWSAVTAGVVVLIAAVWATSTLHETFGSEMDFSETA
ncbi:MAG: MFS transporter [Bacteroidota bacterium]